MTERTSSGADIGAGVLSLATVSPRSRAVLPSQRSMTQSGGVTTFAPIDDLERLKRLQRVSDAALALLSVGDLLDELLLRVRDILGTDTAAVLLLDTEKNELVARAAKGIEEEVERGVRIPVGKGFAGRIAAERH